MELHVVINGRKDLSGQLYQQLRSAIESGRLAAGTQLPPSRLLAEQLGVSRKTVSDTYAQLTYENLLTGIIGKGTYVNARPARIVRKQSHRELAGADVVEAWRTMPDLMRHPTLEGALRYDFIGGATGKGQFPLD
ncbi:GntR family transcriptional regulator, partial [Pseudomonas sp. S3_E04]